MVGFLYGQGQNSLELPQTFIWVGGYNPLSATYQKFTPTFDK
jgi:hypothetical protein